MINLSNRLLTTTSPPPSIELVSGPIKAGDVYISATGSATSDNYNDSGSGFTLIGKVWGGYWAGGGSPHYRNWAGLWYKIATSDGQSMSIMHSMGQRKYRLHKPVTSVSLSSTYTSNTVTTRNFSDPNDSSTAWIAVDWHKFWATPSQNRNTTLNPDHTSSWTGQDFYSKGFLTGKGGSVSNSGGWGEYNNSQYPNIATLMKLYV